MGKIEDRVSRLFRNARLAGAACLLLLPVAAPAQDRTISAPPAGTTLRVRLLAPLTTKFNRKGDMVSASVVEPAGYAGAILEGEIHDLKAGGTGRESAIQFEFHALHVGDKVFPVGASLSEVSNSSHNAGVDDDGTPLETGGRTNTGKGAGNLPRLTVKSGPLSLAPGSEFVLVIQPRKAH
jgi:hypothetical protein